MIWRGRLIEYIMDKVTKNYIDQATAPLHARIQTLEKSNEELRALVKHLQALICYERHYQKPTISATNHMRDSRISNRDGDGAHHKRPHWNSKTKIDYSPAVPTLREPHQGDKPKIRPPMPRTARSVSKQDHQEEIRTPSSEKRLVGTTKLPADLREHKPNEQNMDTSPQHQKVRFSRQVQGLDELSPELGVIKKNPNGLDMLTHKFGQLVKINADILTDIKQNHEKIRETLQDSESSSRNYAEKPKEISDIVKSQTSSPNQCSLLCQPIPKGEPANPLAGMRINLDCNMARIEFR